MKWEFERLKTGVDILYNGCIIYMKCLIAWCGVQCDVFHWFPASHDGGFHSHRGTPIPGWFMRKIHL